MEKRAAEVAAKKAGAQAKVDAVRSSLARDHSVVTPGNGYIPTGPRAMTHGRSDYVYDDDRRNGIPTGPAARRNGFEDTTSKRRDSRESSQDTAVESTFDTDDVASIKAKYMGIAQPKIKKRRLNDRKFVFDWSTDTDTSVAALDTGKSVNVGFGRGHFGGFDHAGNPRGGLDRHWTEKELIEMTERDWRIFREDFNISTKGIISLTFLIWMD
jgi:ATP-dependent RNA helicase DDX23/PRP28